MNMDGVEQGDIVEFPRMGYKHYGVYVGDGKVIHKSKDGKIKSDNIQDVAGGTFTVSNNHDNDYPPLGKEDIVKRAQSLVGSDKYSLLEKNCEHFATWCRYGVSSSFQVKKFAENLEKFSGYYSQSVQASARPEEERMPLSTDESESGDEDKNELCVKY